MSEPVRFAPIYQSRVWGGRRLASMLNRGLPDEQPYGESWELCDRPEAQSVVCDGPWKGLSLQNLWSNHRDEVFGERYSRHPAKRFPILLKILDCAATLSIQVHPPPHIAPVLLGEPKTEMWFVADAEPGSQIYAGLRKGISRETFERALEEGTVSEVVHSITPQRGEFMFVESGRLHALGAGLLVYEIQQNSDTTYRVFDWNRLGLDGKPRDLHVKESLQCIDFADFEPNLSFPAQDGSMAQCPYFETRWQQMPAGGRHSFSGESAFVCVAITKGEALVAGSPARTGDFLLLPANIPTGQRHIEAAAEVEWIEIRLP